MKKISTVQIFEGEIFKEQRLTIGMDLGDHWSCYCILDEAGRILLEQKVATTPEAMKQAFAKIPRSLIALETGTHSPWVSRLLTDLTGIFCTSGSEREFTLKERWYANEEIQAGADRHAAAAD
jgi:hypothetical protein